VSSALPDATSVMVSRGIEESTLPIPKGFAMIGHRMSGSGYGPPVEANEVAAALRSRSGRFEAGLELSDTLAGI
jgi:hypothetical protein